MGSSYYLFKCWKLIHVKLKVELCRYELHCSKVVGGTIQLRVYLFRYVHWHYYDCSIIGIDVMYTYTTLYNSCNELVNQIGLDKHVIQLTENVPVAIYNCIHTFVCSP